ncbi:hypothetical protein T440DRAFT_253888 [Plenodomus tracheiphilus IPT5]|uniref:Major facilitator superfamily (MFS) profile domain-containing protein n=1 Tax=Plenodomus tracheiphilus IPT5 TaxID=1408161 RepID=A0A6A7AUL9_9PLEO|nr:hypothetical protein T440DRAFT_253888 [Plenodomus tracheiphilus IPT5]
MHDVTASRSLLERCFTTGHRTQHEDTYGARHGRCAGGCDLRTARRHHRYGHLVEAYEFENTESAFVFPTAVHLHSRVRWVHDDGLQAVEGWRSYSGEPRGSTLGLMHGAYPIGGLVAVPFISTISDRFGRRAGIVVGALVCCLGAAL